jgi:hypothetical protein
MANTVLTATQVTRESLRILHQKLNFIGTINRAYDDSYAQTGAKIGDTLKIRLPNQYVVRTGATLNTQDTVESSVSLQIGTQKGVDLNFSSNELSLSLDDFSERILEPAMTVLASNIEVDAMSMMNDVYNQVDNHAAATTLAKLLAGRKKISDNLAPLDGRIANLNTQDNVDLVDSLKGLFQDSGSISEQYKEGQMGRTAGFDFYENTLWPGFTPGSWNTSYVTNGATQTGASLIIGTGTGTIVKGDVFTIAGVNRVHPETKQDTGQLQLFVATAASAGGAVTITISPSIIISGPTQNVTASAANGSAVTFQGVHSVAMGQSMLYHKDAFTFATADLIMPKNQHFAAREVMDGISMRIWQGADITNDKFPCRLDVLYGFKTLRPQWACRLANN